MRDGHLNELAAHKQNGEEVYIGAIRISTHDDDPEMRDDVYMPRAFTRMR